MTTTRTLLTALLLTAVLAGCADSRPARPDAGPDTGTDAPAAASREPVVGDTFTIPAGLAGVPPIQVEVLAVGGGEPCGNGRRALIHYVGTHLDGRKFDSSRDGGEPFPVQVGAGGVIKGWDILAARMRVGDRWKVHIPYQLAYGERGHPAGIPPRTDLLFDMELMDVR